MKQSNPAIFIPEGTDKVLLHACCAPCSGAIIEWMAEQKLHPTLFFCNPNIFPHEEYMKRKEELMRHADRMGVPFVDADDDHAAWLLRIRGLEREPDDVVNVSSYAFKQRQNMHTNMGLESLRRHLPRRVGRILGKLPKPVKRVPQHIRI